MSDKYYHKCVSEFFVPFKRYTANAPGETSSKKVRLSLAAIAKGDVEYKASYQLAIAGNLPDKLKDACLASIQSIDLDDMVSNLVEELGD